MANNYMRRLDDGTSKEVTWVDEARFRIEQLRNGATHNIEYVRWAINEAVAANAAVGNELRKAFSNVLATQLNPQAVEEVA